MDTNEALQALLQEYRQVESEIAAMEEERQSLRERIRELMTAAGKDHLSLTVGDETLFLVLEKRSDITYHEELLRERLGAQYSEILEPDPRKMRRIPPEMREALLPFLDQVGSPSRERIRAAIERGVIPQSAFEGAFEKTQRTILYVKKQPPREKQ